MFRHGLKRAKYWLAYISYLKNELRMAQKEMVEEAERINQHIADLVVDQNILMEEAQSVAEVLSILPGGGDEK